MAKAKTKTRTKAKRGAATRTRRATTTQRAVERGVRTVDASRPRRPSRPAVRKRKPAAEERSRATAAMPDESGTARRTSSRSRGGERSRIAPATGGPDIALSDLLRGGMPRSAKAHRPVGGAEPVGRVRRHTRTAYGMASGATLLQSEQPRERLGAMKPMRKRLR